MSSQDDPSGLKQRLDRLDRLERLSAAEPSPVNRAAARHARRSDRRRRSGPLLSVGLGMTAMAIVLGIPALFIPAVILLVLALRPFLFDAVKPSADRDPSQPHIGMGATVEEGAVIEPGASVEMGATVERDAVIESGATVEMGATIRRGAVIKRGATVRMGSTVHASAVIEQDATVGWGVEVKDGAVVGQGAKVGAGVTVNPGAIVPANMRLAPGSTWAQSTRTPPPAVSAVPADPRAVRIDAACAKIDAELRQSPDQVRSFLGESVDPTELRDTCRKLIERERAVRAEASSETFSFLEQEKQALQQKISQATDAAVHRSLERAMSALDDQLRQRTLLRTSADRLDAELTRLQFTLEGMAAQLVRLRTASTEANAASQGEVLQSVQQLHDEIDAIADALQELAEPGAAMEPVAPIEEQAPSNPSERTRTR